MGILHLIMIVTLIYEHLPPHTTHRHNLELVPLNYWPLMTAYFLLVCEDRGGVVTTISGGTGPYSPPPNMVM